MGMRSNPEMGKKHYLCHACGKGSMERDGRMYSCLVCGEVVLLHNYTGYRPSRCDNCGCTEIHARKTGKDFENYECADCGAMIVFNMTHRV